MIRYHALQRQQQRQARQARKSKFLELWTEVTIAASRHDTHSMFLVINKFAPKKPLSRARLRATDGCIADQYQAHALTAQFVRDTWQGPETVVSFATRAPGIPFTVQELEQAIVRVHPNKSVAIPFLPAVVWCSVPKETAVFLMSLLSHWWQQFPPVIPQCWEDSWIFFLPKPGKQCRHPDQLRPISLMERKICHEIIGSKAEIGFVS